MPPLRPGMRVMGVVVPCVACGHHGEPRSSPMIGGLCHCCCHEQVDHIAMVGAGEVVLSHGGQRRAADAMVAQHKAKVAAETRLYRGQYGEYPSIPEEPKHVLQKQRKRTLSTEERGELWKTSPRGVETHLDGVVSFCDACTCDWGSDARGCSCECHNGAGVHRDWALVGDFIHPQWRSIGRAVTAPVRWAARLSRWLGRRPGVLAAMACAYAWAAVLLLDMPPKYALMGAAVSMMIYAITRGLEKSR